MSIIEDCNKYIMNTYGRFPIYFTKGEGCWLYTDDGRKILDMASGIAVSSLGHGNKALIDAITNQAQNLIHASNLYYTKPCVDLAKLLVENTNFAKAFFCNSGAEANEGAIKLARKWGKKTSESKFKILTMKNSFHGRTLATVTATGQTKYQHGFEPVMPGFDYVEFNNIDDLKAKMDKDVCGVMLECVQGEGGIKPVNKDFFQAARELCDKYDALLMVDEVQTGIGRTGKLFAHQHYEGIQPDVCTMAKGLGGGLPIGGMLATSKCCDVLQPGEHASTFGGNPVASAAACVVIKTLTTGNFMDNVTEMGNRFADGVKSLQKKYSVIKDVRGLGLLRGVELSIENRDVINKLIENGVVTVPSGKNVIRFIPPLIAGKDEIDFALAQFEKVLASL